MSPEHWPDELKFKSKLHTIYGLALANLDRFYEAHRHLNEATGILSKSGSPADATASGIVRLRRAEVFLTEASRLRELVFYVSKAPDENKTGKDGSWRAVRKTLLEDNFSHGGFVEVFDPATMTKGHQLPPAVMSLLNDWEDSGNSVEDLQRFQNCIKKMQVAALDDAWIALENAQRSLSGRSQSSLWWGRLAGMTLRVFGEECTDSGFESLAYRVKLDHEEMVLSIFSRGMLAANADPYRRLRLVDYGFNAWVAVCNRLDRTIRAKVYENFEDHLREIRRQLEANGKARRVPSLLGRYFDIVARRTNSETTRPDTLKDKPIDLFDPSKVRTDL